MQGRASLLLLCAMRLFTVIIVTPFVSFAYMLYVPKAACTFVHAFREASLLAACVL